MTVPDPDNASESSDGEVDPFEELGVQANVSNASVSDGLEAFMDDEEDDDTDTDSDTTMLATSSHTSRGGWSSGRL